uniref:Putative group viii salivary lipocalin n=1 Tax=Rhipicephalus pulchellus TaxID=72859 RepID=L7MBX4_RHIPC
MKILVCSVSAFYLFLLASTYGDELKVTGIDNMPGNSSDDLVLVGYSSELEQNTTSCLKSKYEYRNNEWVHRTLDFKEKSEDFDQEVTIKIKIKVCEGAEFLEVGEDTLLRRYTGGSRTYRIRYYDNTSLVLSSIIDKTWDYCSFWVTMDHVNNISSKANETFYKHCKEPKFVKYNQEACKNRFARV